MAGSRGEVGQRRTIPSEYIQSLARCGEGVATTAKRESVFGEATGEDATGAIWYGSTSWVRDRFVRDIWGSRE